MWGGKKSKERPISGGAAAIAPKAAAPATTSPPSPALAPAPASQPKPAAQTGAAQPSAAQPAASPANQPADGFLVLGQMMSVFMSNAQFEKAPLGEIRALVVPAIRTGQFLIATAQPQAGAAPTPVGAAIWARVSDEIDARFTSELDKPMRLGPEDWQSGSNPWLIALAGDRRLLSPLIGRLRASVLNGGPLKMRTVDKEGRPCVVQLSEKMDA